MRSSDYARRYDVLAAETPLFNIPVRKEYVLREIGRGKRVLDLGCLGGQISKLIKEQNNEVYGVEVNPRAAATAEGRGIKVKIFDLNDGIPFEDGFFDVVHAGEIVEHIYDTRFLFEECHRVLRPNGLLLFTTPNLNSIENRLRVLTGGYLSHLGAYPDDHFGEHIRVFNVPKIRELCRYTGFNVMEMVGAPLRDQSTQKLRKYWIRSLMRYMPQFSDLLIVKARRMDV